MARNVFNHNKFAPPGCDRRDIGHELPAMSQQAKVARLFPAFTQVEKGKTYHWCSCGLSAKQPFCDGSHKGTSFVPVKYEATETKRVLFCMCKQTGTAPICNKAHINVAIKTQGGKLALAGAVGLGAAAAAFKWLGF